AVELANYIKYGALPFAMTAQEINSITPILGESALNVTLRAALVAFILVVLFMIIRYRLPGLIASIALVGLVASEIFWISAFNASITLPGIAGIILTIGMGVDANVIIYERIKEELGRGIELGEAIDIGFKRAFSAIFDANVTTLISGGALYIVGSGPIKGFALTLIIGVIMSFFTAIIVVKYLLKAIASIKIFGKTWLYGTKGVAR
ncbi:MAG TPA: SecD/SecF family protein translocase subunit, partial [Clostridia bacterium]|nr:SecD/SecF family protein translocase subunit [Clostridia bacterium]